MQRLVNLCVCFPFMSAFLIVFIFVFQNAPKPLNSTHPCIREAARLLSLTRCTKLSLSVNEVVQWGLELDLFAHMFPKNSHRNPAKTWVVLASKPPLAFDPMSLLISVLPFSPGKLALCRSKTSSCASANELSSMASNLLATTKSRGVKRMIGYNKLR